MKRYPLAACFHLVALAVLYTLPPMTVRAAELKDVIDPNTKVQKLLGGLKFTEGPAYSPDGFLLFSDPMASRVIRYNADGTSSDFLNPSEEANGLMFDAQGNLYACQGRARRVVKIDIGDRKTEVVADRYDGKRLNSPNDLALDGRGGLYFTDPRYGNVDSVEQPVMGVYYVSADGKIRRVIDDLEKPNGILVSSDGASLYVANHARGQIVRYGILAPGKLTAGTLLYTGDRQVDGGGGPDGMSLDVNGNIYATYMGIVVVQPDGTLIGRIPVPERPSNCAFGRADKRTLFITARTSLYAVATRATGAPLKEVGPPGVRLVVQPSSFRSKKEEKTRKVVLEDITLAVPEGWKQPPASNKLRLANFEIPAAEEDKDGAELVISYFGGSGGGVDANVQRWIGQFEAAGRAVSAKQGTSPQGKYILVELSGTFKKSVGPPVLGRTESMPGYRAINVILTVQNKGNYFLKLTGPEKTVSAAADGFRASFGADKKTEKDHEL